MYVFCSVCRTLRAHKTLSTLSLLPKSCVVLTPQLRTSLFCCALVTEGSDVASRTAEVHHSSQGGHDPHLNRLAPPPSRSCFNCPGIRIMVLDDVSSEGGDVCRGRCDGGENLIPLFNLPSPEFTSVY